MIGPAAWMLSVVLQAAATDDGPSFDCARATKPAEAAICADAELSRLDQQIAVRYAAFRNALGPSGRTALEQEQRYYLAIRDLAHQADVTLPSRTFRTLPETMQLRADFLVSVAAARPNEIEGEWMSIEGGGVIYRDADGVLSFDLGAAHAFNARWTCAASGPVRREGNVFTLDAGDGWRLTGEVEDGVLILEESGPPGSGSPPYCGANGGLGRAYFKLKPETGSS